MNLLRQEFVNFSKIFREYVGGKFFPEYTKFIYFIEKRHKWKLDNINNQIKNYIGNRMQ